jgi:hypothetical protein
VQCSEGATDADGIGGPQRLCRRYSAAQADTIAISSHSALATSVPTSSGKDEGKPMPSAEYENLRAVL